MTEGVGVEAATKAAVYVCVQLAIGIALIRRLAGGRGGPMGAGLDPWLARLAVAVGAVLVGSILLRALAHTVAAFGVAEALTAESLRLVAVESRWGARWQAHLVAAAVVLTAAVAARRRATAWPAYAAATLAVVAALPLLGHAGGAIGPHLLHSVHLLGSGAWVGSLGVLALMSLGAAPPRALPEVVRRFSPWALCGAGSLAASGVVLGYLYVPGWSALVETGYGRLLLAKAAVAAGVAGCGALNWRRTRQGLPPRRAVILVEYALALGATALTAVLTETEQP